MSGDVTRGRICRRRRWAVVVALVPALLAGCTGSGGSSDDPLASAQQELEETSGVQLTMSTDRVPQGSDGFLRLEGTATNAPAFDGKVKIYVNDLTDTLPMVAVDGAVYAQLPYTDVFAEVEPADYGTPDPAELMDPGHGIAGWLAETQDVEENDGEVTGRIPGRVIAELFETAERGGTFEATYTLEDDRLQRAVVTGPFYEGKDTTYTLDVSQYDVTEDITRP